MNKETKEIFKEGSKTFYTSSLFFPKQVRSNVAILYSFVRIPDDYIDQRPQQKEKYFEFKEEAMNSLKNGKDSDIEVINMFKDLFERKNFEIEWIEAFFNSMEMDFNELEIETEKELLEYIHGSSEIIGLMMSRILDLPEESEQYAAKLGRAFQMINFIRDVDEDIRLNRQYIPNEDLEKHNLESLNEDYVRNNEEKFVELMKEQIKKYRKWDNEGREGLKYMEKKYAVPIRTSADMYIWTSRKIEEDPFIVYDKKIKPSKIKILIRGLMNVAK